VLNSPTKRASDGAPIEPVPKATGFPANGAAATRWLDALYAGRTPNRTI